MFSKAELDQFFRYCLALTGEEEDAYDLLHDSLEKFLKKRNAVKSSKAYFRKIIKNLFIDHYRKSGRYNVIELDESVISTNDIDLERFVVNKGEVQIILKGLNDKERELLYLWAVEEYTARELADFLNSPRGTILSKLHRLRIRLIGLLDRKGSEEKQYEKNIKR